MGRERLAAFLKQIIIQLQLRDFLSHFTRMQKRVVSKKMACGCSTGQHFHDFIKQEEKRLNERAESHFLFRWCSKLWSRKPHQPHTKYEKEAMSQHVFDFPYTSSLFPLVPSRTGFRVSSDGLLGSVSAEILGMIVANLDVVSAVCLKSSSTYFHNSIKVNTSRFSRCTQWLIMCRLEKDMTVYPDLVACAFCKAKVFKGCFLPNGFYTLPRGVGFSDPMKRDPAERFCALHPEIYCKYKDPWKPGVRRWNKVRQNTCLHCGSEVASGDTRLTGCVRCQCEVCPRAVLPRYVRQGSHRSRSRHFWMTEFIEEDGKLAIRDTGDLRMFCIDHITTKPHC